MSAARAWRGGNPKNFGGQVAMYHVEEARRLREEYKDAALEYQRARVNATKKTTSSGTTVDLHHTTTSQAVILAKECLRDHGASDSKSCPLEFITGRGNHSIGGKAVLRPVVYDALIEDGWNALTLPAGVIVYGRLPD
ncbi:hypothetical protein BC826DRAFT_918837 [Russula brevipes]|nr:hypothetical protein BC826DRAFT_918837 [Russula brevipes]